MAYWCVLRDDEVEQTRRSNGLCLDFDENNTKDRLRSLFDQVLSSFLRNKCVSPLSVLLGDGTPADLFKLFWAVRRRGGHHVVSKYRMWGFVAKESGSSAGVTAPLKLIYYKYLKDLDEWLFRVGGDRQNEVFEKLDLLRLELEECKLKNNDVELIDLESDDENGSCADLDIITSEVHSSSGENSVRLRKNVESMNDDDNEVVVTAKSIVESVFNSQKMISDDVVETYPVQDDEEIVLVAKSVVANVVSSGKRKRESSSVIEMINWVIEAAKHSDDPVIGRIPESSKWKENGSEELWSQALLAREALLVSKHVPLDNVEESHLQKKMRMHPCMYEDNKLPNHQPTERLRCSERLPVAKTPLCPCCNTSSSTQPKLANPRKAEAKIIPKEPIAIVKVQKSNLEDPKSTPNEPAPLIVELPQKQAYIGPGFQVELPEWTGVITKSDPKWLGTKMWPPEDGKYKLPFPETDPIVGKGRPITPCFCDCPDSTDCVRFHIAEKRMGLRREIGLLFYKWRFDRMGEEVSLSWTMEEEMKFKQMVSSHHTATFNFWKKPSRYFPTKTRAKLVSYYFNVLLLRRRIYQNRVMPNDIDSDDDKKEFGSVGDSFGYEAIHGPDPEVLICSLNKQCTHFE